MINAYWNGLQIIAKRKDEYQLTIWYDSLAEILFNI